MLVSRALRLVAGDAPTLSRAAMSTSPSAAARRVVVSHRLLPAAAALLRDSGLDVWVNDSAAPLPRDELRKRVASSAALLAFMTDSVDAEDIAKSPHLRIVAGALKGGDNFDVSAMTREGVYFTRCADLLTAPTAELAVGLAIALGRRIAEGDARVRSGFAGWRAELYGVGLAGSTVGIVGLGAVGRAVASAVLSLGAVQVLFVDPDPSAAAWAAARQSGAVTRVADVGTLVAECDFVFPLTPLTPGTRHLIGRSVLSRARAGALVVNAGRGGCVDEAAIADALTTGTLGGYAADVFELEDWAVAGRRRDIPPSLLADTRRTLFTPHLGSAVAAVRSRIEVEAAENIIDVLVRGVPPRGAINKPVRPRTA